MNASWQRSHHIAGFDTCFVPYVRWLLMRSFADIWIPRNLPALPPGGFVVAANHTSWWDGLLPYAFHHEASRDRRFAVLMSDTELRRFPFFRWGGAFSIDATSARHARQAIEYAGELAGHNTCVWIFPEGRIVESERSSQVYTSGFVHAARRGGVPIVPAAMRFIMRWQQRPEAVLAFGEPIDASSRTACATAERRVHDLLNRIDTDLRQNNISAEYSPFLTATSGVDVRIASLIGAFRKS